MLEPQTASDLSRDALPAGARRGEIGLGDLVLAFAALGEGDEATNGRISRCLGFTGIDPNPPEHLRGAYDANRIPRRRKPEPQLRPPPSPPMFPPLPRSVDLPEETLESGFAPLPPLPEQDRPDWLDQPPAEDAIAPTPVPRLPLFPRGTAKGVLGAAVATRRPGAEPDIPRLIAALVRGHPLRDLPRKPAATLDQGVQLLLDVGEAMTPFLPDLDDLADALERLLGRERCEVFEFSADPARATAWSAGGKARPWRPRPGRPVVLATDFGLGPAALAAARVPPAAWTAFEQRVREAGNPLIAFVPLPPERWPLRLARRLTLIHWDPRTSAAAVKRAVGPGHEVRR